MKNLRPLFIILTAFFLGITFFVMTACEISDSDEVIREVSLNVSGSYLNTNGIPSNQSGETITLLAITQAGDQLNAIDNLGARWTGTIGRASGNTASFTLDGITNTGVRVVLTGTIVIEGTTGTLTGTWIEPVLRSPASAQAAVAAVATATPIPDPTTDAMVTPIPSITATPSGTATPIATPSIVLTP